MRYVLYRFIDGEVLLSGLDVVGGSDEIERNVIDGGAGQVELPFDKLSADVRNSWKETFAPLRRGIALIDDTQPLGSTANALFAGWISSVDRDLENNSLVINFSSMNEYLAMRVAEVIWDQEYVDPDIVDNAGVEIPPPTYKASSWPAMLNKLVYEAFSPAPAGAPQPPSIVYGAVNDTGTIVELPKVIDGTTYYDLLEQVRNFDSAGVEWQFIPTFNGTHVGFNFITGTTEQPFIGAENTETIVLSEAQAEKVTAHSTSLEADGLWNKVLARYTPITEEEEASRKQRVYAAWQSNSTEMPLVSTYQSTEGEYTNSSITSYITAAMHDGQHGGVTVSFTVAEHWNKAAWINRLGSIITFEGVPNTISAGGTATVRCVGLNFNAQNSLVKVDFMPLLTKYPATPKTIERRKATRKIERVGWTEKGSPGKLVNRETGEEYFSDWDKFKEQYPDWDSGGLGGSGGTPETPVIEEPDSGEWTNEGVFNPDATWGSEGRDPFDTWAPTGKNITGFEDYKAGHQSFTSWNGIAPVDTRTLFQHEGNRIYGFDHNQRSWGTKFASTGNTDFSGGVVDISTGVKKTPYEPVFIKMGALNPDGTITDFREVGSLPADLIESNMPEYEDAGYDPSDIVHVGGSYWLTGWYVNGRIYIGLAAMVVSSKDGNFDKYSYNGKITVFSINLKSDGTLGSAWRTEPWTFYDDQLPTFANITRYGKTVVFGSGIPVSTLKVKNLTAAQIQATFSKVGTRKIQRSDTDTVNAYITNYSENPLKNGHILVSPAYYNYSPRIYFPPLEPDMNASLTTYYNSTLINTASTHDGYGVNEVKTNWVKDFGVSGSALAPFNAVKVSEQGTYSTYGEISGDEKWSFGALTPKATNGYVATGQAKDYSGSYQDSMDLTVGRWRVCKVHPNTIFPNMDWVPQSVPTNAGGIRYVHFRTVVKGSIVGTFQGNAYGPTYVLNNISGTWQETPIAATPYSNFGGGDSGGGSLPGGLQRPVHFNTTRWYRNTISNTFSYNGRIWIFNSGGPVGTGYRLGYRSMKATEG